MSLVGRRFSHHIRTSLLRNGRMAVVMSLASLSLSGATLAASAAITATVTDVEGRPLEDALIMFAIADDPARSFTLGQNEAGAYTDTVEVPAGESNWRVTRVVAPGYLPMRISVTARGGAEVVQELAETELSPGVPIPDITLVGGGSTQIRLTLGERTVVMERFAAEREQREEESQAPPVDTGDSAFARALRAYGDGDLNGATRMFAEAIAQDPQNAEIRVTYAKVLYQAKRYEDFEKAARGALEIDPRNGELLMMIYSSARERGDMKAALAALLAVKDAGLGSADLRQHLDYVARKLGSTPEAIPAWSAKLELDPANTDACVNLAALYSAQGDAKRSDEYLGRAVESAPDQAAKIYLDMASSLLAGQNVPPKQLGRGVALLRKALERDPSLAPAYKKLGLALGKQKDWAGARSALQRYLQLSPDADDRAAIEDYLSRFPE